MFNVNFNFKSIVDLISLCSVGNTGLLYSKATHIYIYDIRVRLHKVLSILWAKRNTRISILYIYITLRFARVQFAFVWCGAWRKQRYTSRDGGKGKRGFIMSYDFYAYIYVCVRVCLLWWKFSHHIHTPNPHTRYMWIGTSTP